MTAINLLLLPARETDRSTGGGPKDKDSLILDQNSPELVGRCVHLRRKLRRFPLVMLLSTTEGRLFLGSRPDRGGRMLGRRDIQGRAKTIATATRLGQVAHP